MGRRKSDSLTVRLEYICPQPLWVALRTVLDTPISLPPVLNEPQSRLVELNRRDWGRYAYWIVYERVPVIDIRHHPYNRPDFASHRSKAKIFHFELEVLKLCFEATDYPYTSPMDWWVQKLLEHRQGEIDLIFNPITTTSYVVESCHQFITALRKRERLAELLAASPLHTRRFFGTALELAWGNLAKFDYRGAGSKKSHSFRQTAWHPYLALWDAHIDYLKTHKDLTVGYEQENKLLVPHQGRPQQIPLLHRGTR